MRIFDGRGAFALSDDELEPEEIHESVKEVHCTRCFRWSYHYEEDYETTNPFPEIKKHFPNADNVFCRIGFHSKVSGDVYGFQKIRNDLLNAPQTFVFIKVFYLYVEPMTKCQLEDYLEKNMIRKKYNFWVEKTDPNKMIELKCIYTQDYEHGFFMFDEHKAAEEALTGLPITTPDKPVWSDKIDCPDDYFTVEETRQLQLTFESW
uniref:Uncharacterized protein n=1 Tax=Panagrolaimus sp. JU765 TaxID=591449 RepID=A0AC34QZ11_9BILA